VIDLQRELVFVLGRTGRNRRVRYCPTVDPKTFPDFMARVYLASQILRLFPFMMPTLLVFVQDIPVESLDSTAARFYGRFAPGWRKQDT